MIFFLCQRVNLQVHCWFKSSKVFIQASKTRRASLHESVFSSFRKDLVVVLRVGSDECVAPVSMMALANQEPGRNEMIGMQGILVLYLVEMVLRQLLEDKLFTMVDWFNHIYIFWLHH